MFYNHSNPIQQPLSQGGHFHLQAAAVMLAATALLVGVPHKAAAACSTYYVSTTGNDKNPGTLSSPMASIYTASKLLKACDTLYVRGGVYNQSGVYVYASGTAAAPIKILAYPGESPVLDATGLTLPAWTPFFRLQGQYTQLSGFEVRNGIVGISVTGAYNTVTNMYVHHVLQQGIYAQGDYSDIENNTVAFASMNQLYNPLPTATGGWADGICAARDLVNGITDNAILRGNTVYSVYGEGIATFASNGTLMENNTSYDNWAANAYISDASNVIFRNNLTYNTPNNTVGKRSWGLLFADEVASLPRSQNNIAINNTILNGDISAFSWTIVAGSGLTNVLIANNTVINGGLSTGPINQASVIENNIFYRNDGGLAGAVATRTGLSFYSNAWSSAAPVNAAGVGDVTGDPQLVLGTVLQPGQVTNAGFALNTGSPEINKGTAINGLTRFYSVSSPSTLNIGAYISKVPFTYQSIP